MVKAGFSRGGQGVLEKFQLTDRVAVVVGAGSGIARACAIAFAEVGADVAVLDVDREGGDKTVSDIQELGRKSAFMPCDCSNPASIASAFAEADEHFGRIDVALSGPAGNVRSHPEDMSYEDWRRCLDIGVTSTFLCAQEAGRRMIAQGDGGSIIHLSSIAGGGAMGRGSLGYSSSKGAINMLTKELAIEWARYGIRVNAIQPSQIRTPGLQKFIDDEGYFSKQVTSDFMHGIPLGRLGEPEEVAAAAVFLASNAASLVTGVLLPVDGGNLAMNAGATLEW